MDGHDTDATARIKIGSGVLDKRCSHVGRFEFVIVRPPEIEVIMYEGGLGGVVSHQWSPVRTQQTVKGDGRQ
jgi:hypothetical protein